MNHKTNRKTKFYFMALCAVFLVGLGAFALTYYKITTICHGQCGHGDKQCQERCFAKGECPMECQ